MLDTLKDNVKLVDRRRGEEGIADYKRRYGFVEASRTEYWFDGFNNEALEFLFGTRRGSP
jgi:hypothetical protein